MVSFQTFGVRADAGGPRIDPSGKTFSTERVFRGADCLFRFDNPMGVEHGVQKVYLNGTLLPDNLAPLQKTGGHDKAVQLGPLKSL